MQAPFLGETFRKILIIDLAYIGDLLMATPAISEIQKHFPGADIVVLCSNTSAEVLFRNPAIDEVLPYDKKAAGLLGPIRMASRLRKMGFDAAFVFHRAFASALMARLAGIRTRVGFSTESRGWLLTHPVHLDTRKHRSVNDLNVLKAFGLDVDLSAKPVFIPDPADGHFPEEVLGEEAVKQGYFVVNPNGSWDSKRWPAEKYAALARLIAGNSRLTPVGIGSSAEMARVDEVLGGKGTNLAGRTNISQMGALCRKARLVITNDSGPMHIAAGVGARIIALFGPTDPARCGPLAPGAVVVRRSDLDCIACYKKQCPIDFPCMEGIEVEEIFGIVKTILPEEFDGKN